MRPKLAKSHKHSGNGDNCWNSYAFCGQKVNAVCSAVCASEGFRYVIKIKILVFEMISFHMLGTHV